ncbi:MAG TPA: 16S rRNA (adenine(1518)-N(6)/adenine(1519)-N(6))-dimethyltransferase RsmA, partial [Candidatus Binatia bacterium]
VKAACLELGLKPRKRFGQNFVIQPTVLDAILRFLDLGCDDQVLEIGPGMGFVTRRLVSVARRVWAVEVDPLLVNWLSRGPLGSDPRFTLVHGDILKVDLETILPPRGVKLVANLPYSISTAVLFRVFDQRKHFSTLVLMVQEEVAERMAASPGSKSYGTLSVWCQVHGKILGRQRVSPGNFFPRPKVRSTILKIALHPYPLIHPRYFPALRQLLRASFGQRRKILGNALARSLGKKGPEAAEILRQLGVDPTRRGETLELDEWLHLAVSLQGLLSSEDGVMTESAVP